MKKLILPTIALLLMVAGGACARQSGTTVNAAGQPVQSDRAEVLNRLNEAGKNLEQLISAPDDAIPENVLANAKCVAIVPDMVKGGFVFGGQHGRGVATCRTPGKGWSAPAFFTITGGSWGAQIGAESVDLTMLVMDDRGMNDLLSANWQIGADASIAAGPVGRQASAATDYKLESSVLTYSRTKGLFAGLTLNGANIRQDNDSTTAFYGKNYDFRTLLTGKIPPPAQANTFLASVRQNFRESVNATK